MTGRPVEGDDLPNVFPGVRPTPAAAILKDQTAVDQRDTHRPVRLLTPGPGHPMGLAIEVSMPMQPANIKPLHLVKRWACPLPPIPPARARATHIVHSRWFLVEIIRETGYLYLLTITGTGLSYAPYTHF